MRIDLPVTAWAVSGSGTDAAPDAQREALPPPGTKRRGGRAPLLASALCQRALATTTCHGLDQAAVLFGTGLGCLTETSLFVEHMIEAAEATPKPRAFSSSVHNAIASKVALDLGAHGECQTFVHGEVSFAHAVFAASRTRLRTTAPLLLGAIDEHTDYIERGLLACGTDPTTAAQVGEGGAALLSDGEGPVHIRHLSLGRPEDPIAWLHAEVDQAGEILSLPTIQGERIAIGTAWPDRATHPSLLATATAMCAGVLAGQVVPTALGFDHTPTTITLLSRSRFGDSALLTLSGPDS